MPFEMSENLTITGRRGDSASFTFEFEEDMSNYSVVFQVKKNLTTSDNEAIIRKEISNPNGKIVTFNLTAEDTRKFLSVSDGYSQYVWGVKINAGDHFAQTLIPEGNKPAPSFIVYPSIIEGCANV